ncbi:MAG: aldolase/citrate lyase family protein [Pseudomonadota bacterium]
MSISHRLGCWIDLPSPHVADIVAGAGFDFVVIDCEHGAIDLERLQTLLMVFKGREIEVIVRVPDTSTTAIRRALDAGAPALMIPMVEDVDTARHVIAAARFAPKGVRGEALDILLASDWGRAVPATYATPPKLLLQIESQGALNVAAQIAAIDPDTELFFGPSDYAASQGLAKDADAVQAGTARLAQIAQGAGRVAGTVVYAGASAPDLAEMGYTRIAVASDVITLVKGLAASVKEARDAVQG